MTKILALVRADAAMATNDFAAYWKSDYLPGLLSLPGAKHKVRRIVHNHRLPDAPRSNLQTPSVDWTGVSEIYFETAEDAAAFLADPLLCALDARHSKSLHEISYLHVREVSCWDHHPVAIAKKMFAFFHPRAGMSRAESQKYWREVHGPLGQKLGLDKFNARYIQNHTLSDYHAARPDYDFAGGPELWFGPGDDVSGAWRDPEKARLINEDEARFSDRTNAAFIFTDEIAVYEIG